MKRLQFEVKDTGLVDQQTFKQVLEKLAPEIKRMNQALQQKYDPPYAFVNLPVDKKMLANVQQVVDEKKKLNPCILIVVGVGGSNLGTMAVQQAVYGVLYNDLDPLVKIYYADTVDTDYIHSILTIAEDCLKEGKHILVNVVSKSGKTTETIANFELFLQLLKTYRPNDYADYIVATTDRDSPLWQVATEAKWSVLEIPKTVGGRYSVMSPVGLFPLAMLDVNITELLHGAARMREQCVSTGADNYAAVSAAWEYALFRQDYDMHNLFLFSSDLHALGNWWRQLYGESLGKEQKIDGQRLQKAIVPIVSMGTTDLHSMGQLYLADVAPIITTFVRIQTDRFDLQLPDYQQYFEDLVANMQKKSLASIMNAIIDGIQKAYARRKLPFANITLPEESAFCIGEFLQLKMMETVYLGYLLEVNPFDQPNVELYKKETRKILAHE